MRIAVVVLSVILAVILGVGVVLSALGREPFAGNMRRLRVTRGQVVVILVSEAAAVVGLLVGLWWWPLNAAAAAGIVALMIGALLFHRRARDTADKYGFAVLVTALSAGLLAAHVAS